MANLRTRLWLTAVATLITASGNAFAQEFQPFGPTGIETDWEWFAPAEMGDFGELPDPHVGYFFTYERLNWNITNSPSNDHPFDGNWTWGNRFEVGYMTDRERGWLISGYRILGPVTDDKTRGLTPVNHYVSSTGGGEVMRTWRLKQLHRGSYIEPMLGIRFLKFDNSVTLDELFIRYYANVENNIIGPQIGFRWFRQQERWTIGAEGRFFAGFNHQLYDFHDENTFVPGAEVRFQASYELFRKVALTVGYTGLFLTDGIGQEGIADVNGIKVYNTHTSSHVFMNGINFGFVINR